MRKTAKQLERHFKGISNHRRIAILLLVSDNMGITVDGIARALGAEFATISMHTQKLVQAGLLDKKYIGRAVTHMLSPYGEKLVVFMKSL